MSILSASMLTEVSNLIVRINLDAERGKLNKEAPSRRFQRLQSQHLLKFASSDFTPLSPCLPDPSLSPVYAFLTPVQSYVN